MELSLKLEKRCDGKTKVTLDGVDITNNTAGISFEAQPHATIVANLKLYLDVIEVDGVNVEIKDATLKQMLTDKMAEIDVELQQIQNQ